MSVEPIALSVIDAAKYIGLSKSRLYELVAEGELDARKLGARTVVTVASLKGYVNAAPKAEISYHKVD